MDEYLSFFLKTIGLEEEKTKEIINNRKLSSIEEKIKSSILFILENNENVNREVEEKILGIDLKILEMKLFNLGAIKVFDGHIIDNRYDFSDMLFRKEGILLRTRETKNKNIITLKKRINNNRSLRSKDLELETEIEDINSVITCFKELGLNFVKGKKYTKHRISYELDGVHFDFDKYRGIDWLLEIEANDEKTVQKSKILLGLENYKTVKYGYRRLKEEQVKK